MTFKFKFFAIEDDLFNAWTKYLSDLDCVSIHKGNILKEPTDCIVSPANSFGYMDGGIDRIYRNYFNKKNIDIQKIVHNRIKTQFHGEITVGTATQISTTDEKIPYMVLAPTMRLPTKLSVNTEVPYLAMRAILLLISNSTTEKMPDNNFDCISIPGFGTGIGGVPAELCAAQVRRAIDDFWFDKFKFPTKFDEAVLPFTNRTPGDYKNEH